MSSIVFGGEIDPKRAIRQLAQSHDKLAEAVNALAAVVTAMAEQSPPDKEKVKDLCRQVSMLSHGLSRYKIEALALQIASGGKPQTSDNQAQAS